MKKKTYIYTHTLKMRFINQYKETRKIFKHGRKNNYFPSANQRNIICLQQFNTFIKNITLSLAIVVF